MRAGSAGSPGTSAGNVQPRRVLSARPSIGLLLTLMARVNDLVGLRDRLVPLAASIQGTSGGTSPLSVAQEEHADA